MKMALLLTLSLFTLTAFAEGREMFFGCEHKNVRNGQNIGGQLIMSNHQVDLGHFNLGASQERAGLDILIADLNVSESEIYLQGYLVEEDESLTNVVFHLRGDLRPHPNSGENITGKYSGKLSIGNEHAGLTPANCTVFYRL